MPGASNTVLDATVPYSTAAMAEYLGQVRRGVAIGTTTAWFLNRFN